MSKRKLLLADDSMTIQKVVNLTFADEGIEVFTVGNGSLAIEKLAEIEPDLVLADVHMPGLNGYEVCEQIRMNPRFRDVPVMLLVGSFEPFDEREAQRVGANDFLTKPFQSIRQLIQKVTALLDGQKSEMAEVNTLEPAAIETEVSPQEQFSRANTEEDFYIEEPMVSQSDFDLSNPDLSDAALDDEMIETSSANGFENGFPAVSNQSDERNIFAENEMMLEANEPSGNETGTDHETVLTEVTEDAAPPEMRHTEPISFDDIREINSLMLAPMQPVQTDEQENVAAGTAETAHEPTPPPADLVQTAPADNWSQLAASSEKNGDEFEVELDLPAQEQVFQNTDFEFVNNEESYPAEGVLSIEDFGFSTAPKMQTNENTADDEPLELDLADSEMFRIDDEDSILDLDEEETVEEIPAVEFETVPALPETSVRQNFSESPHHAALAQIGNQAVANLNLGFPPEVIEAIAQLVVEKLSDKVIERIAWEIVPDRFDRIVRQQMDQRSS